LFETKALTSCSLVKFSCCSSGLCLSATRLAVPYLFLLTVRLTQLLFQCPSATTDLRAQQRMQGAVCLLYMLMKPAWPVGPPGHALSEPSICHYAGEFKDLVKVLLLVTESLQAAPQTALEPWSWTPANEKPSIGCSTTSTWLYGWT
jgi:hypothetical protein